MPNVITAGNSSNGGTAITTDTSGTLEIKTGTGSGTTAISIDASQNVTIAGTISASGGVSGGIRSGTVVTSTSGTSIDFTSIPSGVKRITVMFSGVSTNGSSNLQIQLGDSGGFETTGYNSVCTRTAGTALQTNAVTSGFLVNIANANNALFGAYVITLVSGFTYTEQGNSSDQTNTANYISAGGKTLSDTLTQVRITTVNGTDTFDAGSINILYE